MGVVHDEIEPVPPGLTRERLQTYALAAVTVLALYLCYLIAAPFIPVLTWALALAIVARPAYRWIAGRVQRAEVAASLSVAFVALVIVLPAIFVAHRLVREAREAVVRIQQSGVQPEGWDERFPWLAEQVAWAQQYVDLRGQVERAAAASATWVAGAVTGSAYAAVQLLFVLYILFYLFCDKGQLLRAVREWLPLTRPEADKVFQRVDDTVHASVYGTLICAAVQGAMGGLIFWLLGISGPVLWGTIMALLAVVPFLGAFVIWFPAAIGLALAGSYGRGAILAVFGLIAIGLVDNLLYPLLVGKRLRLHTVPVFIAIVGGLAVFGAAGVILGPVAFAVTSAILDVWKRRTAGGQPAEAAVG